MSDYVKHTRATLKFPVTRPTHISGGELFLNGTRDKRSRGVVISCHHTPKSDSKHVLQHIISAVFLVDHLPASADIRTYNCCGRLRVGLLVTGEM